MTHKAKSRVPDWLVGALINGLSVMCMIVAFVLAIVMIPHGGPYPWKFMVLAAVLGWLIGFSLKKIAPSPAWAALFGVLIVVVSCLFGSYLHSKG